MNSKFLMTASAVFLGSLGTVGSFLADDLARYLGNDTLAVTLLMQLASALYLGFGMLNWMAKSKLIGGIYSRPVALGNFAHFAVGALALVKGTVTLQTHLSLFLPLTILYTLFAGAFAWVLFTSPRQTKRAG
ncbi:hypothetical protein [Catalinimonas alkaloidigena]|nr:hypothetical protein [Catalinimonas alkaloidigena]